MEASDNKPQEKDESNDFGLPKAAFKPIERREKSDRRLKILITILGIIFLLGGVYYLIFQNLPDKVEDLTAHNSTPEVKFFDDFATEESDTGVEGNKPMSKDNPIKSMEEPGAKISPPPTDKKGEITNISAPQGTYFVVVGSFVDRDIGFDYANRLAQQGVHIKFIEPYKKKYFSHVAVDQGSTFHEANSKAVALKSLYGEAVWVLKY